VQQTLGFMGLGVFAGVTVGPHMQKKQSRSWGSRHCSAASVDIVTGTCPGIRIIMHWMCW
jgi:hypothetical protein